MNKQADGVRISFITDDIYNKQLIEQVVGVHMKTFTGFFLTFLGERFLNQLYKGYCFHAKSGLILAEQEMHVVGFLAYSEDLSGFYKYLIKKRIVPFAWYSLGAFLRKPSTMMQLIRAFLKPGESKREESYIELASIGVLPEMKNQHIGGRLIEALKDNFDDQKFAYIKLETDAENNDGANHFYIRNGFVLVDTYATPEGRKMNEYRWSPQT